MLIEIEGEVVGNFEALLAIEIRIAAIYAGSERVGDFQVRLGGIGGEIEGASRELQEQFVGFVRADQGSEMTGDGLVAEEIVLEGGRQIESVVQRRLIGEARIGDEIAGEEIVVLTEIFVEAQEAIVEIAVAQDI